ncbi:hypothetical protein CB0940_03332 [Cercospora beticola]|uniref:Uncharacterized protein n=1 Tax=Cercospora beticola TaxID=122368 RepID=A0A2G5I1D9_CERBT|nr:hypothetical protein CB0940_03332 [Cercospora beticola]PIA98607.1 hypothetical protein CB0940_03332 [Cercospora beticola]WPB00507.1 hypothetical protein RHO25_005127 [Cercospora beticola]CAK1361274.1 unnamed protein product [Cercospora beticola]
MSTTKSSKEDLVSHVIFPAPSLKDVPKHGTLSKEDRLKIIISNLEKHQQAVRIGTLNEAKTKHQASHAAAHDNQHFSSDDEDRMDISPGSPAPEQTETDKSATSQLLDTLRTPYRESSGDPVSTSPFKPPPNVQQKTQPPEIQAAKEALNTIATYDSHALPSKRFYIDALARLQGGGASGNESRKASAPSTNDTRKASVGSGVVDPRRASTAAPAEGRPLPNRTASGSVMNRSADPRLAGRSASYSHKQPGQSPAYVQSPKERPTDPRLARR